MIPFENKTKISTGLSPIQLERIQKVLQQWRDAEVAAAKSDFERNYADTYNKRYFAVGGKYIRLNIGGSGAFMVDMMTGLVYGIKGYGKVDKKKISGDIWDPTFDGAVLLTDRFRRGRFDNRVAK